MAGGGENGGRRNTVALQEDGRIATHDLAARDPPAHAVANHQGPRAGHVAQRLENPLATQLLHHGDRHRDGGEDQQHQGFSEIAQDEIDDAGAEQQREHRLAQHITDDAQERPMVGFGKVVETFGAQPDLCFCFRQAADRRLHDELFRPARERPWFRPHPPSADRRPGDWRRRRTDDTSR